MNAKKKTEAAEALKRSEEMYRATIAASPDIITMTDLEGRIILESPKAQTVFGFGRTEDRIGRDVLDYIVPEDRERARANIGLMFEGVFTGPGEYRLLTADGSSLPIESNAEFIRNVNGSVEAIVIVTRDITDRKRIQDVLRDSEAKFHRLIKNLPLPLIVFNSEGELEYSNDRFVQTFGYGCDDTPTQKEWQNLAFPDEKYRQMVVEIWSAAVTHAVNTGQDVEPIEYNITCKNGNVRSVIVSGIVFEGAVLLAFTDITDRRRQEQLTKSAYERRRNNNLMNELIRESPPSMQTVFESARILGAKMMAPCSCFLIAIDENQEKTRAYWQEHGDEYHLLLDSMLDALEDENRILWDSSEGIGVLWFDLDASENTKDKQKNSAEQLRDIIVKKIPEVKISVGIAERAANMADIGTYFRQARTAVSTGQKVWPHLTTYHYLDMGVFQLLSCFTDETQITAYIERTLGKLLQPGKKKNIVYLETLGILLMSDNLKEGAAKLSIHYHTLMFRKQRLEKILGVSFDDFSSRMAILTALHLYQLRKH